MVQPETKKVSQTLARKKQTPEPSAPERPRRKLSPVARFVSLAVLLALAINLAIAYWGHQVWVEQGRQAQLSAFSQEITASTAGALADQLRQYQAQLNELAAQTAVIETLITGDAEARQALGERLQRQYDFSSIRILPAEVATTQATQTGLSFTELDLIARAENREAVTPEAARQGENWLLKLVTPVPANPDSPVLGTLLATLPVTQLRPVLARNQRFGELQLQQTFQNRRHTLLSIGQGEAGDVVTRGIDGSYWELHFTPSRQLWHQTQVNLLIPGLLLALFALLTLVLAVYLGRRLATQALARQQAEEERHSSAQKTTGKPAKPAEANVPHSKAEDILDIEITEEDEALLGLEESTAPDGPAGTPEAARASGPKVDVPEFIFRAYDIRGLAETEITPELADQIGRALGSEALDNRQDSLVVARDARTHSPVLAENLIKGILSTGCGVINLGAVPTPLMYFATETLPQTQSGVMVTASHNGAEYNGFKVVITGKSRSADDIQNIRHRILSQDFYTGQGAAETLDIVPQYIDTIFSDVALAGEMHVVLDAGNGITGTVAPQLFEELGCRVAPLFCDLDGNFPNHEPDPSVAANLQHLVARVNEEKADLGIAFDGDGDRLTVVAPSGEIVWADRLLMLFAKDIIARNPGADVVFDVKSTRQLSRAISEFGGRPIMWKTGHAPMRAKMRETGALVGGEFSGHIFIKDRWFGFDDGIYAAARLIEIISLRGEDLDTMLAEFPPLPITPEFLVPVAEDEKFAIVRQLQQSGDFSEAKLTTLDGLRADFPYGWGLVRASNTSANLTLRFEAETDDQLHAIRALFTRELQKIDPTIRFD